MDTGIWREGAEKLTGGLRVSTEFWKKRKRKIKKRNVCHGLVPLIKEGNE